MEINVGDYVRTKYGIAKYIKDFNTKLNIYKMLDKKIVWDNVEDLENIISDSEIINHSKDIIDLIEYMDLLVIENPIKLYDKNVDVNLFNPVRCDGFTTYEDGTTCILLNLDYLVDVKNLKIKKVLTHESFEANAYTIEKER